MDNYEDWTLVVVEGNEGLAWLIKKKFEQEQINVVTFRTGKEALSELYKLNRKKGSLFCLLNFQLPDMSAKELVQISKKNNMHYPFIILTNYGHIINTEDLVELGAINYLQMDETFFDVLVPVTKRSIEKYKKVNALIKQRKMNYQNLKLA